MTTDLTPDELGPVAVSNDMTDIDLWLNLEARYIDGTMESTEVDDVDEWTVREAIAAFYERDHEDRREQLTEPQDEIPYPPASYGNTCGCRGACFCYDVPEEILDDLARELVASTKGGLILSWRWEPIGVGGSLFTEATGDPSSFFDADLLTRIDGDGLLW